MEWLPAAIRPAWVDQEMREDYQRDNNAYRVKLREELERLRAMLSYYYSDVSSPTRDDDLQATMEKMDGIADLLASIHHRQILVDKSDKQLTLADQISQANTLLRMDSERMESLDIDEEDLARPAGVAPRRDVLSMLQQRSVAALPVPPGKVPVRKRV